MFARIASLLALLCVLSGCATAPGTGRSQLNLIDSQQLASMANDQYQQVRKQEDLVTSGSQYRMVQRVGRDVTQAADEFARQYNTQPPESWDIILIDDDEQANAWAMPGGKLAVYTGLLPFTKDEDGLAMVMGHETAHVLGRHANERMSQAMLANLGMTTLQQAMREQPQTTQQLVLAAAGVGAQVGVMLPYSRLHESEADRNGMIIGAMAGYNPRAAIDVWQRMQKGSGGGPPEFLSTHPAHDTRIARLKEHLPEAMEHYRHSK